MGRFSRRLWFGVIGGVFVLAEATLLWVGFGPWSYGLPAATVGSPTAASLAWASPTAALTVLVATPEYLPTMAQDPTVVPTAMPSATAEPMRTATAKPMPTDTAVPTETPIPRPTLASRGGLRPTAAPPPPPPPTPSPPPPPPAQASGLAAYELGLINGERRAHGLAELAFDPKVSAVSQAYAEDMARRGYFAHVGPEGGTILSRLAAAGLNYGWVGENLARYTLGDGPAEPALQWVQNYMMAEQPPSDNHRQNILSPNFRRIGIAVYRYQGTLYLVCDFVG